MRLLGGTYDGKIVQLLRSDATTDGGTTITGSVKTGWLSFGAPVVIKRPIRIWAYGKTAGASVTIKIYVDGEETTPAYTYTTTGLSGLASSKVLTRNQLQGPAISGNLFKFEITGTGPTVIHGLELDIGDVGKDQRS